MYAFFLPIADFIGIIGVLIVVVAYYLLSVNKINANTWFYQLSNFSGSALVLFSLFFHWNTASALVEAIWMLISFIGLLRIYRHSYKQLS